MNYTRHFECGCKIVVVGQLTDALINYCPKHEAAPELYKALKELVWVLGVQGDDLADANIAYVKEWNLGKEAIAKAEAK